MIAKFEYLTKSEARDLIEKTVSGINGELRTMGRPTMDVNTSSINYPRKGYDTIIACMGFAFVISNAGRCRYDIVLK